MIRENIAALLCAVFIFTGCGGAGMADSGPSAQTVSTPQAIPADTTITLERTECFGVCPVYKVTISADGTVTFHGERHVEKMGVAKGSVSREEVGKLVARFEAVNYFSLKDAYTPDSGNCTEVATDHPSANTSISMGGKFKSVRHYHGCTGLKEELKGLTELEDEIDEVADTARWIKK
jgi:hypothetical protein